ncbi:DUF362 domain-containing protein [Dethiobacter alkaliphilus]|uniref:DUF362 domain-containing protein n=1 Tax=Dethiobacter alkaliphilus AHT 1 TaxID=555088 RepID=C0GDD7_DETAL|nr:DUF362 domain-containing protein [Dethiobacter alkaliphilus]EEG78658.1 protein of unknown function DUF362 [Dethiobacter alkaliphilus AHT 1]
MEKLYVMYGAEAEQMAFTLLETMDVAGELAGMENPLIGIKPNLVVSQPAEWGATTDPNLVRGVIKYLQQHGFCNIIILESAWVGDSTEKAFDVCGYRELGVPLVDLKKDDGVPFEVDGTEIYVCKKALEVDYLINMPVLKAHCQTRLTCALKNLKGCVPDKEKRRFHTLGLHKPIAALNKVLRANIAVVDGIIGDLTYEEGGTPVRMNRSLASRDPVLIDTYAAELIGYEIEDVPYIRMAEELGIGSTLLTGRIVELNNKKEARAPESLLASNEVDNLARWIEEDQACSACYGSLIHALMRLQEKGKLKKGFKVHIGQGCKKLSGTIGVGECSRNFEVNIKGCPPKAKDIVSGLEEWINKEGPAAN